MQATDSQLNYIRILQNQAFSKRITLPYTYQGKYIPSATEASKMIQDFKAAIAGTYTTAKKVSNWPGNVTPAMRRQTGLCCRVVNGAYCNAKQHSSRALCETHAAEHDSNEG